MPMVTSAALQTTARQPLPMDSGPTASIAMAGSQYSMKTSHHRLDRMSRDSQVVASDFIPRTAASVRSRQFYNLERSPGSREIAVDSRANGKGPDSFSCLPTTPPIGSKDLSIRLVV